jgi:FtsH-binding integral membrane protein
MADTRLQYGALGSATSVAIDEGLRAYMLRVYNYMGAGLALSGAVGWFVASNEALMASLFGSGLGLVVALAPFAFVMVLSFGINRIAPSTAQMLFWAFAVTMGVSLAPIAHMYTGASIARVFFVSAATFGAMSLYGYTTKRNLAQFSSFLIMGLIGVVIASIVNIFLGSPGLDFVISVIGVLVFVGLTAHDTQMIREWYVEGDESGQATKKAVYGALSLYLDFLNLFLMLLRLFGERR